LEIKCNPVVFASTHFTHSATVVVPDELITNLDQVELKITNDYYSSFRNFDSTHFQTSADEYLLGSDERWSDKSLLCPEMPIPSSLSRGVEAIVSSKFSCTDQAVALIHAGRQGCIAPVHFDWDHRWIAHACLTGRKRFFLFSPDAGWFLNPIINTSSLCIPRFSESDLYEFIQRSGGVEIVLEAGQGILFPSMFWHGVYYDDASLAISIRFESQTGGRPFAVLPRSWLLQRLIWEFFQQDYKGQSCEFLKKYIDSFFQQKGGWKDRYRRITMLCRTALLDLGKQQGAAELIAENFSAEVALAAQELRFYYGNVRGLNKLMNDDCVQNIMNYIFETEMPLEEASMLRLAAYASEMKQGLPPKRGIINVIHKKELL
jgi:hypothetical protein